MPLSRSTQDSRTVCREPTRTRSTRTFWLSSRHRQSSPGTSPSLGPEGPLQSHERSDLGTSGRPNLPRASARDQVITGLVGTEPSSELADHPERTLMGERPGVRVYVAP